MNQGSSYIRPPIFQNVQFWLENVALIILCNWCNINIIKSLSLYINGSSNYISKRSNYRALLLLPYINANNINYIVNQIFDY